jgi:hypothetical protein
VFYTPVVWSGLYFIPEIASGIVFLFTQPFYDIPRLSCHPMFYGTPRANNNNYTGMRACNFNTSHRELFHRMISTAKDILISSSITGILLPW